MVMALDDLMFEPAEDWREKSACAGIDSDLFFPIGENDAQISAAKDVCSVCPVVEECLQYALSTNQTEGIWGGMTGPERRRLRRRIRDRQRKAS